jgi:tyrosyl-tRNA synthetase
MLAKEITTRFHSAALADAAEQDFVNRSKGGVPDVIPEVNLSGAPLGIAALLKSAGLAPSSSEASRLIDGGGVRIDGSVVSDKGLKLTGRSVIARPPTSADSAHSLSLSLSCVQTEQLNSAAIQQTL